VRVQARAKDGSPRRGPEALLPVFRDCAGQHLSKRVFQVSVWLEAAFIKDGGKQSLTREPLRGKLTKKGLSNIDNAFSGIPRASRQTLRIFVDSFCAQLRIKTPAGAE